ncbi:MAG TPA: hypothetical protein VF875_02130 [Anaeromyxobacter sp.]
MTRRSLIALQLLLTTLLVSAPRAAQAIPSFARKYETSCLTCHTVYPKLNPFGEAFRRNGYRFPGVDGDVIKQAQIALGQEANKKTFPKSVWPSSIPGGSVLAVGANGQVVGFPDPNASVPRANPGLRFSFDDLVNEAHLWAGAALDDTTTIWAELTLASDGTVSLEHAQVLLNDLLGPKHALNLVVGRGFPTLSSFGPHSSYLGDSNMTVVPVTGIYGLSGDPFILVDDYNGAEVNGVLGGHFSWSAGVSNGKNAFTTRFSSENVYGHVGWKLGGLRMDGEGVQGPANAMRPWAEDALTLDLFAYRSVEHGGQPQPDPTTEVRNVSVTYGAAARGQLGSAELNVGAYLQDHDHGSLGAIAGDFPRVKADVEWAELSYVVFPWMVPAVRVERIGLMPNGAPDVNDVHVMPGIAFLLRANVKAVLVANFEFVNGFAQDPSSSTGLGWAGGNADWGNFVASPKDTANPGAKLNEVESIALFLAWAM